MSSVKITLKTTELIAFDNVTDCGVNEGMVYVQYKDEDGSTVMELFNLDEVSRGWSIVPVPTREQQVQNLRDKSQLRRR